jgi:hydrophobic/amphiphilic exporter-1 (mainly G- bacteria), HAE1 family
MGLAIWTLPKEILPQVDEGSWSRAAAAGGDGDRGDHAAGSGWSGGATAGLGGRLRTRRHRHRRGDPLGRRAGHLGHGAAPHPRAGRRRDAARFANQLREALPDLAAGMLALDLAGQSEFGSLIGREGRLVRVEVSARTLAEDRRRGPIRCAPRLAALPR